MTPPVMRAAVLHGSGGAGALRLDTVPVPTPGPGEVLIRVRATAVNRADILQRSGRYTGRPPASGVLGLECSGTVEALGPEVPGWRPGDEVCALLREGGYAEYAVAPAGQLMPVPPGCDLDEAAALPEALCTVYSTIVQDAALRTGETVLVHGGGSGIGTTAIQVVRALGGTPLVTVGSDEKACRCRALGAAEAVNYRSGDFVAQVHSLTGGRGADIILDSIGRDYLQRNIDALADDGRLVIIGLMSGGRGEIDLGPVMRRRLSLRGATLRDRSAADKAGIVAAMQQALWPHVASGAIRPVIDTSFPLTDVAGAHDLVESSRHFGKVLIRV